jgi:uncharacterized protein GlcG (DUF336 family)
MSRSRLSGRASLALGGLALTACALLSACGDSTSPNPAVTTSGTHATQLPTYDDFKAALTAVQQEANGGLGFNMWGTIVDRRGVVIAVVFTGQSPTDEWPGSRVISAQKANTANAFSLTSFALSTANLYAATQPGGSLFGLQESNPVNDELAYEGEVADFGTPSDPLLGKKLGGVNVFGGGLALYGADGVLLGAVGVSGDLSCADHIIAWKVRDRLGLDFVPAGVNTKNEASPSGDDNIIYDLDKKDKSAGGFGHPVCNDATKSIGENLPTTNPLGDAPGT